MRESVLDIKERCEEGWMRVCVAGEIDLVTSETLMSRLRRLHAESGDIQLDLSQVEFMDCRGVRVLTEQIADARRDGQRFEIAANVPLQVRCLFELVGLKALLERQGTAPPFP